MMANWLHEDMCGELTYLIQTPYGGYFIYNNCICLCADLRGARPAIVTFVLITTLQTLERVTLDALHKKPGHRTYNCCNIEASNQSTRSSSQRTHFFRTLISWSMKQFYDKVKWFNLMWLSSLRHKARCYVLKWTSYSQFSQTIHCILY